MPKIFIARFNGWCDGCENEIVADKDEVSYLADVLMHAECAGAEDTSWFDDNWDADDWDEW